MSNPQVEMFVQHIRIALPNYADVAKAAEYVKGFASSFAPLNPEQLEALQEAITIVEKSLQPPEIIRRRSIIAKRAPWYTGPSPLHRQWNALQQFIANELKWNETTIQSLDESSSEVLSLMPNPATSQFRSRGLVLGYVQSGKTANMTAVIAKAVDVGYNLIVVLGGTTNKLRAQTQRRLERDIVDRHPDHWLLYTKATDEGDFIRPANGKFIMPIEGRAQLVVIKKECSRLEGFLETARSSTAATLKALRVLIIDDECDQASVNSSTEEDTTTRTNELIRRILHAFHAVSYVGYTATPFANVFINPIPSDGQPTDDLYPADFITMLDRPVGYFGAREVFRLDNPDPDSDSPESDGMGMLRLIPADEVSKMVPSGSRKAADFHPALVPSMEKAILWFIASCALRSLRGQGAEHMSMLVHTSALIEQHERLADIIRYWLDEHSAALLAGSGKVWEMFRKVYAEETGKVALDRDFPCPVDADSLRDALPGVFGKLVVTVENSMSEERLDYTGAARANIIVGGSVLARGLTLEGLCVSLFLRTSRQYDTLLQMGRWFGYRHGYADLPRLWTTGRLIADFRSLAVIEEEIRDDISRYREDPDITPMDIAVRVRSIPGLAITSAAKMRHAYRTSVSFEGKHIQTIRFNHRDAVLVKSNWEAAAGLFAECDQHGQRAGNLFRGVPIEAIRRFLRSYSISDAHFDLDGRMLVDYLNKSEDLYPRWNVAVVTPASGNRLSARELGPMGNTRLITRSKLADTKNGHADIKALMSKSDILVDATQESAAAGKTPSWDACKALRPDVPLLLVYPIDSHSPPRDPGSERKPLDAVADLIGIGIVFPGNKSRSGKYFAVELDVTSAGDDGGDGDA